MQGHFFFLLPFSFRSLQIKSQSDVVEQRARDEQAAVQAQVEREKVAREAAIVAEQTRAREAEQQRQADFARQMEERKAQQLRAEEAEKIRSAEMERRGAEIVEQRRVEDLATQKQLQYELGDLPQSKIVSDLAYAAGSSKKGEDARKLVEKRRDEMKAEFQEAVKRIDQEKTKIMGNRHRVLLQNNIDYLEKLQVTAANSDAIAIKGPDNKTVFGFRGTAKLRDLIPDIQLAVNSKKVGRVEEAKKFVAEIVEREKLNNADLKFVGHSLGGFVAEGVRNQYVGSSATTFSSGAPIAAFVGKDKKVRAWGDYQKEKEDEFDRKNGVTTARITRVIRNGDAVSGSLNTDKAANGRANIYHMDRTKDGQLNLIANHLLRSDSAAKSKFWQRDGVFVGDYQGEQAADLAKGSETKIKDQSLATRIKNVVRDKATKLYRDARYYVRPGKMIGGVRSLDMQVDRVEKVKQRVAGAVQSVRQGVSTAVQSVRQGASKLFGVFRRNRDAATPSPRRRAPRTAQQVADVKARWAASRARVARSAGKPSPRRRAPRTAQQVADVKARWAASRARVQTRR